MATLRNMPCCDAQGTVPLVELNSYQRHWFLASMACSPLFVCVYMGWLHWLPLLGAGAAGAALGALAAAGTRALGHEPPFWGCGTHFPIGAWASGVGACTAPCPALPCPAGEGAALWSTGQVKLRSMAACAGQGLGATAALVFFGAMPLPTSAAASLSPKGTACANQPSRSPTPPGPSPAQVRRWWRCTALPSRPCGSACLRARSWRCCTSWECWAGLTPESWGLR